MSARITLIESFRSGWHLKRSRSGAWFRTRCGLRIVPRNVWGPVHDTDGFGAVCEACKEH